ncbi:MAG: molybdopterin-dependent oxidoreductase, partial [Rhizobacter sp.]|nr:molybdopterin-dependent oxidoreductase [Rhizobacter sp.]
GQMIGAQADGSIKAFLLLNLEPALDSADGAAAAAALKAAEMVVSLSPFKPAADDPADVVLPIAPFTETSGTYVNAEGRVQSFHGVVKPLGETRPAWKVLRVLGNLLELTGFDFETSEDVRAQALGDLSMLQTSLSNAPAPAFDVGSAAAGLERIADVPIYCTDAVVRRARTLQQTADAQAPVAGLPKALWAELGLAVGDLVRVSQGVAHAVLPARLDASLAPTAVRVAGGHASTASLGALFGPITVEKV